MKYYNLIRNFIFLSALALTVFACNDEDSTSPNIEELLIGHWITTEIEVITTIAGQPVKDYLINVEGVPPAEAAMQDSFLNAELVKELEVELTINEDHTYESVFGWGMDSGTWSLSEDGKTLTLIEGGEEIIATIHSITDSRLEATLGDEIEFDIDGDPGTPDITIDAAANIVMEK